MIYSIFKGLYLKYIPEVELKSTIQSSIFALKRQDQAQQRNPEPDKSPRQPDQAGNNNQPPQPTTNTYKPDGKQDNSKPKANDAPTRAIPADAPNQNNINKQDRPSASTAQEPVRVDQNPKNTGSGSQENPQQSNKQVDSKKNDISDKNSQNSPKSVNTSKTTKLYNKPSPTPGSNSDKTPNKNSDNNKSIPPDDNMKNSKNDKGDDNSGEQLGKGEFLISEIRPTNDPKFFSISPRLIISFPISILIIFISVLILI
ncbi:hypothetical protein AYI69_g3513 [Smittium culicis]|uniref:Uncharacterized protein n=1 Tax=Smittium culicis TaxID=133412 RepID=A0A1R1YJZ7_9FUNG|nr:hypothetical protein AYI69_g7275 [Smittium culicis]OMJ27056.1 hypothetical protein AYI69_g3513 [Smittium culicis]